MQNDPDEAIWQTTFILNDARRVKPQTLTITGYQDGIIHAYIAPGNTKPDRVFDSVSSAYEWLEDFTLDKEIKLDSKYDFRQDVT